MKEVRYDYTAEELNGIIELSGKVDYVLSTKSCNFVVSYSNEYVNYSKYIDKAQRFKGIRIAEMVKKSLKEMFGLDLIIIERTKKND